MLLHRTPSNFLGDQPTFASRTTFGSTAMDQDQSASQFQSTSSRITPPPRVMGPQPLVPRVPSYNRDAVPPPKTKPLSDWHRKTKPPNREVQSQPPLRNYPANKIGTQIYIGNRKNTVDRPVSSSQPTPAPSTPPPPLSPATTEILDPTPEYTPRHFSCYDHPPIEPRGVWVEVESEPIVRDYAYKDLKIPPPQTELVKTEPWIDPDAVYESQPSQQSTSYSQDLKRGGTMYDEDFFSQLSQSQPQGLKPDKTRPVFEPDEVYYSQDVPALSQPRRDPESYQSSQGFPRTPQSIFQGRSYDPVLTKTPLLTPNGSLIFDNEQDRAKAGLFGREIGFDQASRRKLEKLASSQSQSNTHNKNGNALPLGPPIEIKKYPFFDSQSPLSSLSSLGSMGPMAMDQDNVDSQEKEAEEDEIVLPTRRRQRRLSAPCEAMSSLSLINPDAPVAVQRITTPPPHGYNLRNNRNTASTSAPSTPPRRKLPKRKATSTSPISASPRTRQKVKNMNVKASHHAAYEEGKEFEYSRPLRKRSRDDDMPFSASGKEDDKQQPAMDEDEQPRMSRTRSSKVRKLA